MAYKTISLIVTDADRDAPALSAASGIAQREGAHLDVHCIGIDMSHFESLPVGATAVMLESTLAEARDRACFELEAIAHRHGRQHERRRARVEAL